MTPPAYDAPKPPPRAEGPRKKLPKAPQKISKSVWPSTSTGYDSSDPDVYKTFMLDLHRALKEHSLKMEQSSDEMWCENDTFNRGKFDPDAKPVQQALIPMYLSPTTPYHGLMLYHEVGTGKTRNALRVLGRYRKLHNYNLIWITSDTLKKTTPTEKADWPAFYEHRAWKPEEGERNPFFNGATTVPSNTDKRRRGKIALFSYREFVNAYTGYNQKYVGYFDQRQRKYGDKFANTIIVIDEAHKIFERTGSIGNGAYKDQDVYQQIASASYANIRSERQNVWPCKWLLLTATPAPMIDPPSEKSTSIEIAGGVFSTLRLLNLLIAEPSQRFDVTMSTRDFRNQYNGISFANRVKGLVSFFRPTNWKHVFAATNVEKRPEQPKEMDHVKRALLQRCRVPKNRTETSLLELAQCYMRRLHWFGPFIGPKMAEDKVRGSIVGPETAMRATGGKTELPGGLIQEKDREINEKTLPLGAALLERIKELDKKDFAKYGRKFKHVIISNDKYHASAAYAAYLVLYGGFKYVSPEEWPKDKKDRPSSDTLMYMHNDLVPPAPERMKNAFNDRRNNYGQFARVLVLGSKRKEGVSLFSVRYMHILEEQINQTNMIQMIGRGVRRCGHVDLTDKFCPKTERKPDGGCSAKTTTDFRRVNVFVYGLQIPDVMQIKAIIDGHEETTLGAVVNAVIKSGKDLGEKIVVTDQIVRWMEATSIDIVGVESEQDLKANLDRVVLQDLGNYALSKEQPIVAFAEQPVQAKALKVAEVKDYCRERGLPPEFVKQIKKVNQVEYYQRCSEMAKPSAFEADGDAKPRRHSSAASPIRPVRSRPPNKPAPVYDSGAALPPIHHQHRRPLTSS